MQYELAEKLGSSLHYAETQHDAIRQAAIKKEEELETLKTQLDAFLEKSNEKQLDIREEIGYYDRSIREAQKKTKNLPRSTY